MLWHLVQSLSGVFSGSDGALEQAAQCLAMALSRGELVGSLLLAVVVVVADSGDNELPSSTTFSLFDMGILRRVRVLPVTMLRAASSFSNSFMLDDRAATTLYEHTTRVVSKADCS